MPDFNDFHQKHILNPNKPEHRQYEQWDKRQQNNWLRNRLTNSGNPNLSYGRKNLNSVIIATSQEIMEDFKNPGMKYEKEADFYWSNKKYPIWIFRKKGGASEEGQYSVTKLNERYGPMHFLARTAPQDGFKPIHFHAQSPTPSPNDFPRYTDSESFSKELLRFQRNIQLQLANPSTSSSSSDNAAVPPPPRAGSSLSFRGILRAYLIGPVYSFGNFILNEVILKIFFIK